MNVNEELQRWGEAPLTAGEEELLALLDALAHGVRPAETVEEPPVAGLLRQLEQSTASFGSEAGLLGSPDAAAEATTLPNPFPAEFRFLRRWAAAATAGSGWRKRSSWAAGSWR